MTKFLFVPLNIDFVGILQGGPEVGGIFVKALQPGGAADQDGRIAKGISYLLNVQIMICFTIGSKLSRLSNNWLAYPYGQLSKSQGPMQCPTKDYWLTTISVFFPFSKDSDRAKDCN